MAATRIERFLQPGEYAVGDARHCLRTLLGSCVSITLWHPAGRIGAMSHFLLPTRGAAAKPAPAAPDARYGEEALLLMLRSLARRGVEGRDCTARIFGGGNMFPQQTGGRSGDVGRRNGVAARAMLQALSIAIESESLFGVGHRQIVFDVATGDVRSHQVRPDEWRATQPPLLAGVEDVA